jgi:hypothetical protein
MKARYRLPNALPLRFCSDPDVQRFCEDEAWAISVYSLPESTKSARQLFEAARKQFGDYRCIDLEFCEH